MSKEQMSAKHARRRPLTRKWAILLTLALVLCSGGIAFGLNRSDVASHSVSEVTPSPTRGSTKLRAIHVAPDGDDRASGSAAEPMRTIDAAIKESNAGETVVVHSGTYREELKIENRPGLKLVAAPDAEVWLDGSVVVSDWEDTGDGWVSRNWVYDFDPSPTYSWGKPDNKRAGWSFVNADHPMAAHPDQVWIDDERQVQVQTKGELRPGRFYVDPTEDELWLGSNPADHQVTASAVTRALRVRSAGMRVEGIGVRKYAPSVPHMGAVTIEAPDVTLTRVTIADNATTGMHVLSSGVRLSGVKLRRNGMMGLTATGADNLQLVDVDATGNNVERFNQSPAAGGVKVGRSSGVLVRDSTFADNLGTGLWFDESVSGIQVLDSRILGNSGHGISIEISGHAIVMGNVIARNHDNGLKINDAEDVEVWNNTFVDNNRSVNVVQDDRDRNPRGSFRDPDSPLTWQTQGVAIRNNILVYSGTDPLAEAENQSRTCLLCVQDFSGRWTAAEMDVTALGNVYSRPDANSPKWIVVWSRRSKDPYVFRTVDQFRRTVHQEETGVMYQGTSVLSDDLRPRPALVKLARSIAQPLPEDVAEQTGHPVGTQHLGAWID